MCTCRSFAATLDLDIYEKGQHNINMGIRGFKFTYEFARKANVVVMLIDYIFWL